jgi:hypothetical protein
MLQRIFDVWMLDCGNFAWAGGVLPVVGELASN